MSAGVQPDQFLEDVNPDFICSICFLVLLNPVSTPCDHHFCEFCVRKWLKVGNNTCPTCRSELSIDQLKPMSRIIVNILGSLKLRCPNVKSGCTEIITYENLELHEDNCKYDSSKFVLCNRCGSHFHFFDHNHQKICMVELIKENDALHFRVKELHFQRDIFLSLSLFFLIISFILLWMLKFS